MIQNKLELTWVGKYDEKPALEPRILIENPEYSYGDDDTGNMLIHGDNLLALKALEQEYAGKIKCVYIDPPYNTGSAFTHYDDNLEHSIWLNLMRERLVLLRNLLCEDGSIWVTLDDNEVLYCKVLMAELFGRSIRDLAVRSEAELEDFCHAEKPDVAILCVPMKAAEGLSERLIALGIRNFWNFSHYDFSVKHPEVIIENVHMNDSLMTLCYRISNRDEL